MLTLNDYNRIRSTNFAATPANEKLVARLDAMQVSEDAIRAWQKPAGRGIHELRAIVSHFAKGTPAPTPKTTPATPATPAPKAEPVKASPAPATKPATATGGADALIAALNSVLKVPALDADAVRAIVEAAVDERIKATGAARCVEVKTATGTHRVEGTTHAEFEHILQYLANGDAVYIYGPAGTGKTHMAQQLAAALELDFYYSGQLSQEYQFTGFIDANGTYQETPFYKAWKYGGLFFFDELDRSFAEVVTKLNGALANGLCDFPCGIIPMHPNFRCMAAGNTIGRGATGLYTAANTLDASSLDRFRAKICVDYDKRIEDAIDAEAAQFVRTMRKAAGLAGLDVILSYRAIQGLAKYADMLGIKTVIKDVITATLATDDINILRHDSKMQELAASGNKFAVAFAA